MLARVRKALVNVSAKNATIVGLVARIALALEQRRASVDAESVIGVAVVRRRAPVLVRATIVKWEAKA